MALTNSQYNSIMRRYEAQQLANHRLEVARKQEVYEKLPKLREIDQKIADLSFQAAVSIIEEQAENASELQAELKMKTEVLIREKEQELEKAGYSADYLAPQYACTDCKDTGYIGSEKCHCFQQAELDLIYRQTHITNMLQGQSLSDFSLDFYSETKVDPASHLTSRQSAEKGLAEAKKFVANFSEGIHSEENQAANLLIYGDTGTGKTFLSNGIAHEIMEQGHSVLYFTAFQFFELAEKHTFSHDSDTSEVDEDYENLLTCDLLILDDLGTEFSNRFSVSQFFQIINERLIRNRSTVLTTNLSLKDLNDRYSERIFSRISSNYTLIKLFGDDVRLLKKFNTTQ